MRLARSLLGTVAELALAAADALLTRFGPPPSEAELKALYGEHLRITQLNFDRSENH